MIWLPETFRKERSLAWRLAMQRARAHAKAELLKARADLPTETKGNDRPARTTTFLAPSPSQLERSEAPPQPAFTTLNRVKSVLSLRSGEDNVKIHLRDVNVSSKWARRSCSRLTGFSSALRCNRPSPTAEGELHRHQFQWSALCIAVLHHLYGVEDLRSCALQLRCASGRTRTPLLWCRKLCTSIPPSLKYIHQLLTQCTSTDRLSPWRSLLGLRLQWAQG